MNNKTYFDVPRMLNSTSGNYLTTGIASAWHLHLDTWYSFPSCQINWCIPIYDIRSDNAMAFHNRYWNQPMENNSRGYNYYEWNQKYRGDHIRQFLREDPRPLPKPTTPIDLDPQIRLIIPPGSIILFSAAQLHSTVPNTSGFTRFSLDFRTVHEDDVHAKRGVQLSMRSAREQRCATIFETRTFSHLPDDIVALYDDGTRSEDELIYHHKR